MSAEQTRRFVLQHFTRINVSFVFRPCAPLKAARKVAYLIHSAVVIVLLVVVIIISIVDGEEDPLEPSCSILKPLAQPIG